MSKRRKQHREPKQAGDRFTGRRFLFVACGVGVVALVILALSGSRIPLGSAGSGTDRSGTNSPGAATESRPSYQKLLGKWVRPDGGYVIEIKGADESGKLEATYSNPDPIHVARAEASGQGAMTKVFIELRDVNYPGSTYTLAYDPTADQLKGVYFQAVEQQQYEIHFERIK